MITGSATSAMSHSVDVDAAADRGEGAADRGQRAGDAPRRAANTAPTETPWASAASWS